MLSPVKVCNLHKLVHDKHFDELLAEHFKPLRTKAVYNQRQMNFGCKNQALHEGIPLLPTDFMQRRHTMKPIRWTILQLGYKLL